MGKKKDKRKQKKLAAKQAAAIARTLASIVMVRAMAAKHFGPDEVKAKSKNGA
jgi:hypothetical protein